MIDATSKMLSKLKQLGIYQIVGGAIGVILILWSILNNQEITALIILIYFFMLLFFVFSVYCGISCLKQNKSALRLSLINQIFQITGFAMFGFAFHYSAGVYLTGGLDLTESFNFTFGAGISRLDFNINNENQRLEIDFNFIAFGLVIFIDKVKKQFKEEEDKNKIASIATT